MPGEVTSGDALHCILGDLVPSSSTESYFQIHDPSMIQVILLELPQTALSSCENGAGDKLHAFQFVTMGVQGSKSPALNTTNKGLN